MIVTSLHKRVPCSIPAAAAGTFSQELKKAINSSAWPKKDAVSTNISCWARVEVESFVSVLWEVRGAGGFAVCAVSLLLWQQQG